ncbi:MAG: 30S ribosomal protein S3 [Methanobacteriota archaeon]|nr:MAG: 30S ribosomal protein S3 [Euryarchaeota archaeon]
MAGERKIVIENIRRVLLKEHLIRKTERAGFGGLDIQRTPLGTRVTLLAERPGLVIGRRGKTIKGLTQDMITKFEFDNPQIEVEEVKNPATNAQIMADKLASALERGWHFRRAGHSTVRRIMESGARGCQVTISGKLTGRRHRTEKFKQGHIKHCGEPKLIWMKEGFSIAKVKLGVIGVKVLIMESDAELPDEITIFPPAGREEVVEEAPLVVEPEAEAEEVEVKEAIEKEEKAEEAVKEDVGKEEETAEEKKEVAPKKKKAAKKATKKAAKKATKKTVKKATKKKVAKKEAE